MCGKKLSTTSTDIHPAGSPPRMRGEDIFPDGLPCAVRITPACAGKSGPAAWHRWACRDHPRMCGEKCPPGKFFFMTVGSPPRMRGKGGDHTDDEEDHGITPACAGKSCPPQAPTFTRQDHPRVCGEKTSFQTACRVRCGSPPHVRGKAGRQLGIGGLVGITPACAGKSVRRENSSS